MRFRHIISSGILTAIAAVSLPQAHAQSAAELLGRGRAAYRNYNFSEAAKQYAAAARKLRKGDTALQEDIADARLRLASAESFLGRVEQIAIIDSISVPRSEFFKAYRIPSSSGRLGGADDLPYPREDVDYVFTNEGDDYKVWAEPDSLGALQLVEATRLTDGKWGEPQPLSDDLREGGENAYPFMMADGVTLYYASNGDNSIGGYDIMIATRDPGDGTFLQPQNLGFPYNSPYDDYLLAIDELNGVGWWATDRNQLGDDITIYVYVTNDLRRNYDADEEDIISLARIDDYIATQDPDSDYDNLLTTIREIQPGTAPKHADFHFQMPGGVEYTSLGDFKSPSARAAMKRWLEASKSLAEAENSLDSLRRKYHSQPDSKLGKMIADAEKNIENQRTETQQLRNEIYKAEKR